MACRYMTPLGHNELMIKDIRLLYSVENMIDLRGCSLNSNIQNVRMKQKGKSTLKQIGYFN